MQRNALHDAGAVDLVVERLDGFLRQGLDIAEDLAGRLVLVHLSVGRERLALTLLLFVTLQERFVFVFYALKAPKRQITIVIGAQKEVILGTVAVLLLIDTSHAVTLISMKLGMATNGGVVSCVSWGDPETGGILVAFSIQGLLYF